MRQKKVKIIDRDRLHLASNRIKKNLRQKSKRILKKANKKAADWLKKAGYLDLGTNDLKTINYNDDTNINDLVDVETIDYNNDTNVNGLDNSNLKKILGAQIAA